MKIHFLTNENKILQEKMRFFADYFSFVNKYIGLLPELPLDNSLSLSGKIKFQINNNLDNSPTYIENYFKQIQAFYTDPEIIKSPTYILVEKQFLDMKTCYKSSAPDKKKNCKVKWITTNPDFIKNIERLEEEYRKDFDINFDALFSYIQCSHSLKQHKENIKYCAQNLVSELRLNGITQASLNTYVDRILGKDSFPLPVEILRIKDKKIREEKTSNFFSERRFKEQFYGFKNLVEASQIQSGYLIYKIENCRLEKPIENDFYAQLDQVVFISPFHNNLRKIRAGAKRNDKERSIKPYSSLLTKSYTNFFSKNNILAYIKLNYENQDAAMKIGLHTITQELSQLNGYLNTNLFPNTNDYLFAESLESNVISHRISSLKNQHPIINERSLRIAQENPFEILRNTISNAKQHLLLMEKVFFQAVHSNNISTYWIYVENLFWNTRFDNSDEMRRKVVRIILNNLKDLKINFLRSIVDLLVSNIFIPEELNITYEERKHIYNEIYINQNSDFDISFIQNKINNHLFDELIKYNKSFLKNTQVEKWRVYFSTLLLELYEFRNAELHSGRTNKHCFIKLTTAIPQLINQLRWSLVNGCKVHPQFSFEELIDSLSK